MSLAKMGVGPALFFLTCFIVLTYPAVTRFRTHLFADEGDGLQNVWNIWWVNKAVTMFHQDPWHTTYLHYPYGTSLIGHTLNPFNGFVAIPLSRFMSLVPLHNVIVTFSFVMGGLTAFLLAHHLTGSYFPSLFAGFIFTFSSFHFAHAEGHLQLVSLEWIPLFVLLWLKLVTKPTIALGACAALTLFLVILCDHYYFFYCVLTGSLILCWILVLDKGPWRFLERQSLIAFGMFAVIALASSGILAGSLVLAHVTDPLVGAHTASEYSLDLLAPFIYGGHWRFATLTSAYWSRLPGNIHESSVHLGLSVMVLVICAWSKREWAGARYIGLFSFLLAFFFFMALGPTLQIAGKQVFSRLELPYAWLEAVFPPLRLSGVPVRMMVMVVLSASMICALTLKFLFRSTKRDKCLAMGLILFGFIEYLPKSIPTSQVPVPEYVRVLKDLPGTEGVVDTVADVAASLFYQTIHEKPLALGYLARVPRSVDEKDRQLEETIREERYDRLWYDYGLKYAVTEDASHRLRKWPGAKVIWSNGQVGLFDISEVDTFR